MPSGSQDAQQPGDRRIGHGHHDIGTWRRHRCESREEHEGRIVESPAPEGPAREPGREHSPDAYPSWDVRAGIRLVAGTPGDDLDVVVSTQVLSQLPKDVRGARSVRREVLIDDEYPHRGNVYSLWRTSARST